MFRFLILCFHNFGLISGTRIYLQVKVLHREWIRLPRLANPIHLRKNKTDINTFREIFLREEYAIAFPANFKPHVIIDAGANIGLTSLFFLRQFPDAKIISLEPDSGNYTCLKENTSAYKNVTAVQAALWHKKGSIEIADRGYGVRGFMVEESASPSVTSLPATTLNDLIREFKLPHIDILKMDIEGSEKEVFEKDFATWLPLTRYLIIELHDRMKPGCSKSVFKALDQFNFECSIKGENLVFTNKDLVTL